MSKSKSSVFSREEGQWCRKYIAESHSGRRVRNLRGVIRQIELLRDWESNELDADTVERFDETVNVS